MNVVVSVPNSCGVQMTKSKGVETVSKIWRLMEDEPGLEYCSMPDTGRNAPMYYFRKVGTLDEYSLSYVEYRDIIIVAAGPSLTFGLDSKRQRVGGLILGMIEEGILTADNNPLGSFEPGTSKSAF